MSGAIRLIALLVSVGCIIECGGFYTGEGSEPSTEAPSTAAPTTQAPSTTAPSPYGGGAGSTEAPSTAAPSTEAPSTAAPTTEAPTTTAPSPYGGGAGSTEAPSTAAPSTEAPTTTAPSTEAPSTAAPFVYGGGGSGSDGGGVQGMANTNSHTTTVHKTKIVRHRCFPKAQRYDKCRRLCKCSSDGTKWECFRLRKEFTTMTKREKKRYIQAYREISRPSNKYNKKFSELIATHKSRFMTSIHQQIHFLPWHRWYLLQIENLLRKIDCRVTLPYWDWSVVSGDPWIQELWNNGTYTGFGGNGVRELGYCVPSGPFSNDLGWKPAPSNQQGCTKRYFRGNPPDIVAIEELLKNPAENFTDFEVELRIVCHDRVHCVIGGTMCSLDSASAPEFFLHHNFIDKIWDDWQQKSPAHRKAFFYNVTEPLPGTDGLLPRDLIDNSNLPGGVKVQFLDINDTETQNVRKRLRKLTSKELMEIVRADFDEDTQLDEIAMNLFKVSPWEKKRAKRRRKRFRPKHKKRRRMMRGRRAKRWGFELTEVVKIEKIHFRRVQKFKIHSMRIGNWHGNHRNKGWRKNRPKKGPKKTSKSGKGGKGNKSHPTSTPWPAKGWKVHGHKSSSKSVFRHMKGKVQRIKRPHGKPSRKTGSKSVGKYGHKSFSKAVTHTSHSSKTVWSQGHHIKSSSKSVWKHVKGKGWVKVHHKINPATGWGWKVHGHKSSSKSVFRHVKGKVQGIKSRPKKPSNKTGSKSVGKYGHKSSSKAVFSHKHTSHSSKTVWGHGHHVKSSSKSVWKHVKGKGWVKVHHQISPATGWGWKVHGHKSTSKTVWRHVKGKAQGKKSPSKKPAAAPSTKAPTTTAPSAYGGGGNGGGAGSTEAPSTAASSTQAPSTAASSTQPPSTAASSTDAPSTSAPSTEAPSTTAPSAYGGEGGEGSPNAPSSATPSTNAPSSAAASTEAPSSAAPSTEASSTSAPSTEASTTTAQSGPYYRR